MMAHCCIKETINKFVEKVSLNMSDSTQSKSDTDESNINEEGNNY